MAYPGTIDVLTTTFVDGTTQAALHAAAHNAEANAIMAIETELGTLPKGDIYASVKTRLDRIEFAQTVVKVASYQIVLADRGLVIEFNSASGVTLTVPPNATAAFPIGSVVEVHQYGAGQVTLAPGAGVTFRSPNGWLKTAVLYSSVVLRKRATDEWVLAGDLAP